MSDLPRLMRLAVRGFATILSICAATACAPTYLPTSKWAEMRRNPLRIQWHMVSALPHSTDSYTEGLTFVNGRLFESIGLYDKSALVELDPKTGSTLGRYPMPDRVEGAADRMYAEGIAANGDQLVQLSWKAHIALVWNMRTLQVERTFGYQTDGWGLCFNGKSFIRSDGYARLLIHQKDDFALAGEVPVTLGGSPLDQLNELECVNDNVFANVWRTPFIVRIDKGGNVTGVVDLQQLVNDASACGAESVLNGIARDPGSNRYYVTGKSWPKLYVIELSEQ